MDSLYSEPELKDLSIRVIQESRAQNEVIHLEQRLEERKKELEQAEAEKNKEVKEAEDVNNIFMRLLFSAKVEKEELQAYAAQERYDLALEVYKATEEQLQKAKRKQAGLEGSKEKYEKKYAAKREALLAEKGADADKILELEKKIDTLIVECKEAKEALDICNEAFETAVLILNRIGDAEYSAKMEKNVVGYAAFPDFAKLDSEMVAIKAAKDLRKLMNRLRMEMQDIALCMEIRDACLDTNSIDWHRVISGVNSSSCREVKYIKELSKEITAMSDDISRTRKELESYINNCETQLKTKQEELKQIMFR